MGGGLGKHPLGGQPLSLTMVFAVLNAAEVSAADGVFKVPPEDFSRCCGS